MKININKYWLVFFVIISIHTNCLSQTNKYKKWENGLRGINIKLSQKYPDFKNLKNDWDINLVRLSCNNLQLRSKNSPYNYIEENWDILDSWLDSLSNNDIYVVLDIHTFPGAKNNNTTFPSDLIWQDRKYQDTLIETWGKIANRYKNYKNIVGYDLINEPTFYRNLQSVSAWNYDSLIIHIVEKIRHYDITTPVIIELPRFQNEDRLHFQHFDTKISNIKNAIFSTHYYFPPEFTRQGLNKNLDKKIKYPGFLTKVSSYSGKKKELVFDKEGIKETLKSARNFQIKNKCIIFIGEFSCLRWAPGGDKYIEDLISLFEEYGWSWCYHSYRGYQGWDAELGNDPNNKIRYETKRVKILKGYFKLNN